MTAQRQDTLTYRGRSYALRGRPLDTCTDADVRERMTWLQGRSSALWRGYRGTWEIKAGRLWLVDLEATIREHHNPATPEAWQHADRGMDWLFPDALGPVLADWFTGVLESPRGRAHRTRQYSYETPYIRFFNVKAGTVISTELHDNRKVLRAELKRPSFAEMLDRL